MMLVFDDRDHRNGQFSLHQNLLGGVYLLFAAVNNLFDVNNHPIFIAQDSIPCTALQANQNGACGNSMPGREVIVGAQVKF